MTTAMSASAIAWANSVAKVCVRLNVPGWNTAISRPRAAGRAGGAAARRRSRSGGGRSRRTRAPRWRCRAARSGASRPGSRARRRRPGRGRGPVPRRRSERTVAFRAMCRPTRPPAVTVPFRCADPAVTVARRATVNVTESGLSTIWTTTTSASAALAVGDHAHAVTHARTQRPGRCPASSAQATRSPPGNDAVDELVERAMDAGQVAVVLQVVGLDVGDDRDLGPQQQERAVALVGLDHRVLTGAEVGVAPGLVQVAADGERRVQPARPAARWSAATSSSSCRACRPRDSARRSPSAAASAAARRSTRSPRSRPATSSMCLGGMAVE